MTRINVGMPPERLTDRHLMAEHREIKRIPNCVAKGRYSMTGIPDRFTLGAGHVKFFYPRCGYLLTRYKALHAECLRRGFNVTDYSGAWSGVPAALMGDYTETDADRSIIEARIAERLA
jgi:deoxyribonuclease (pyrimidine dimer)